MSEITKTDELTKYLFEFDHGIIIVEAHLEGSATLVSHDLKTDDDSEDAAYNSAIDGMESLVLKLCVLGLVNEGNIETFTKAIGETVEVAANNF